jgi:DNA-binding XRE family transcriptional regulator
MNSKVINIKKNLIIITIRQNSNNKENKLTRDDLAKLLNISRQTLTNWEKEKPELVRLINQGFALDESIEATEQHLKNLKAIKEKAAAGKFKLK